MFDASKADLLPIEVNDREQLIYLLTEAAEIEHGLMCSYLYAAWTLKQSVDEGLTAEQCEVVKAWRGSIVGVAIEEMLHLALVSNLLSSLGAAAHFSRPNFPLGLGYHPSCVVIKLVPFTPDTAEHFVYLERPEGQTMPPANGFEPAVPYKRVAGPVLYSPTAQDYGTVSHLYQGIASGFKTLTARLGEEALFIGRPEVQVDPDVIGLDGMVTVTGLHSALAAISTIVEQGEGTSGESEHSHYQTFVSIRDQYHGFQAADPAFRPYRNVAVNPLMFAPVDNQALTHVSAQPAARILDLANACYGLMLRMLSSGFDAPSDENNMRKVLINGAISIMPVMQSLAVQLTKLPASHGSINAGMNFHLPRSILALPQRHASLALFQERLCELASALTALAGEVAGTETSLPQRLLKISDEIANITLAQRG
jgi:hypothetical protein